MKHRVKWLAATAAAILAVGPASANHQWGSYHWANNGTGVTLTVKHTFANDDWDSYYSQALSQWQSGTPLTLVNGGSHSGTTPRKCDPISGQILVCNDSYGYRGWLGIATVWASGSHISQATTKLNDSYFSLSAYNTPEYRALVACQEIGHDFGLDHQDENFSNRNLGTCMDYTNAPQGGMVDGFDYGDANIAPNAHDREMLNSNAMYGSLHKDSGGGSGGGGNCNPKSPKCNAGQDAFTFREVGKPAPSTSRPDSSEWGQAVGRDGAGRPDTFLLDLGNGLRKITHVYWVPGFRPEPRHMHDEH